MRTYYCTRTKYFLSGRVTSIIQKIEEHPSKPKSESFEAKNCTIYWDWHYNKEAAQDFIEESLNENIKYS